MSIVIKLNGTTFNNSSLPTLNGASLVSGNLVDVERDSVGHYLFGGGSYSLTDMTAQLNHLTPLNVMPTMGLNFADIESGSSLDTGILFGQNTQATLMVVFKNEGQKVMPLGTMLSASSSSDEGIALFTSAAGDAVYVNGRTANAMGQSALSGLQLGHVFCAASIGNDQVTLYSPNVQDPDNDHTTVNKPGANASAPRNMVIGPYHYGGGFFGAQTCEVVIYDKALSLDEMRKVYSRSKYRMAKRGINI